MTKETGELSYKKHSNNSVGVLFCAQNTNTHLFLLRNNKKNADWGLPGGKVEKNETLRDALERECIEEINFWPISAKLFPIEQFTSDDQNFIYHTFYCLVDKEFIPKLNHEHIGYCWINGNTYPKPLHRGLFNTLNYKIIQQKIQIIHDAIK
jgi:ADP-ribose pyrophosphatase YjhB (NUDIX family)